jgi:magnesium transporter
MTGSTSPALVAEPVRGEPEATEQDRARADGPRARLFDADRTDERLELGDALKRRLSDKHLLWIDAPGPLEEDVVAVLDDRLKLSPTTIRALGALGSRPYIAVHGKHLHLRVLGEPGDASGDIGWVDILVAPNLVVTAHDGPAEVLARLDERIKSDATVGRLTSASFLRALLDAIVTTYFEGVDAIEDLVDDLDARSLLAEPDEDILPDLVEVRRRITRLRRLLSDHREVYAALAHADVAEIAGADDEGFGSIAARFEDAIHSVEDSRDLLLGSFDVFMSRLAQRTNDAMKILALATVLLLPGSLIAGLLGMNVVVPLSKDDPMSFWIVVVAIVALAAVVLVVAWRSGWIKVGRRSPTRSTSDGATGDSGGRRQAVEGDR